MDHEDGERDDQRSWQDHLVWKQPPSRRDRGGSDQEPNSDGPGVQQSGGVDLGGDQSSLEANDQFIGFEYIAPIPPPAFENVWGAALFGLSGATPVVLGFLGNRRGS